MISYEPRNWFGVLVGFVRSGVFRVLVSDMVLVGGYAAFIVYLEKTLGRISVPLGPSILSILGIILGLVLVFRTNTAYDRWWEGRRLWGQLVNVSRALARQLAAQLPTDDAERRRDWARRLRDFPQALAQHLRLPTGTSPEVHQPNRILAEMAVMLHEDVGSGRRTGEARIALTPLLTAFDDVAGACERIRSTPIPLSYSSYVKQFILLFALLVPFALAEEFGYGAVIAEVFIFFATAGIDLLATEIEEPFGTDANDLPLDSIAAKIVRDVTVLLEPGTMNAYAAGLADDQAERAMAEGVAVT
jgi:putative membrane protein